MPDHIHSRLDAAGEVDVTRKVILKTEFGRRVWQNMVKKDMNQSDLARASGLGRDSISQYVRGRNTPSPQNLVKLAKALNVDPNELLPNHEANAVAHEVPTFQIQQIGNESNAVWLHVNQRVTSDQALRVMQILNEK